MSIEPPETGSIILQTVVSQLPTTEVMGLPFHLPLISKGAECNRLVDSSPELFHYVHDKPLLIK